MHRTGAPWRDVPRCFGRWESVQSCFSRWSKSGLWASIWEVLRQRSGEDHEALYLDSTSVKAHRHSAGARGKGEEAIGRARGGRGTKVHAVCDGLGYPLAVALTAAQEHDAPQAAGLLEGQAAGQVVADRGYDSDALRETIKATDRATASRTSFAASRTTAAWPPATRKRPPSSPPWSCSRASSSGSNVETAHTA